MSTQRRRANKSLGGKINQIETKIAKAASTPQPIPEGTVQADALAENSVTNSALAPGSVTDETLAPGSVGTQSLGVVNRINSDSTLFVSATDGIALEGTNFKRRQVDYTAPATTPTATDPTDINIYTSVAMGADNTLYSSVDLNTIRFGTSDRYYTNGKMGVRFYDSYRYGAIEDYKIDAYCDWLTGYDPLRNPGNETVVVARSISNTRFDGYNSTGLSDWVILGTPESRGMPNKFNRWSSLPYNGVLNNIDRYNTNYEDGGLLKTIYGIVLIRGMFKSTTAVSANTTIRILPVAFRPDTRLDFVCGMQVPSGSFTTMKVEVHPDGRVVTTKALPTGTWFSLGNISYPAAGVASWTTVPASAFGTGYEDGEDATSGPVRYWVDRENFVWWSGLVRNSIDNTSFTSDRAMVRIDDANARPVSRSYQPTICSNLNTFDEIRIDSSATGLVWVAAGSVGNTNATHSLANICYPNASASNWITPTFQNSWVTFSANTSAPRIYRRYDGINMTMGLYRGGTINASVFLFSTGETIESRSLRVAVANNAIARSDFPGTHGFAQSGSNAWFSFDGQMYNPAT